MQNDWLLTFLVAGFLYLGIGRVVLLSCSATKNVALPPEIDLGIMVLADAVFVLIPWPVILLYRVVRQRKQSAHTHDI